MPKTTRIRASEPHNQSIYREHGYENRADYLAALALDYDPATVYALAELLGPSEDFDGLITTLGDME